MTEEAIPDLGARLLADRVNKGLSRAKYAAEVGLTIGKISNLEKGRPPKPEEIAKLQHLVFVEPTASTLGVPHAPIAPAAAPPAESPSDAAVAYATERSTLINTYNATVNRLEGKPSKIPYHLSWGTPDVATPAMWPRILTWCVDVNAWLDELAAGAEEMYGDVVAPAGATDLQLTVDDVEPEIDEEPELAIVTEPTPAPMTAAESVVVQEQEIETETAAPAPAFPDDGVRRFSNGQLRTFKRCKREYWLTYYRRLGLASEAMTGAAPLGTRVHRCLAVWYVPEGQPFGDPLEELQRTYAEDIEKIDPNDAVALEELRQDIDLAQAMLEGYMQWLEETGADEGLTIVAPETALEVDARMPDVGVPVHLIAKLDVRAIRSFAGVETRVVVDHKTVQSFADVTKMVQFDEQMLHYHLCEFLDYLGHGMSPDEANQIRTDGAIYNMLRKVKRTASAKPPFYDRVEIRHNLDTLRSYWLRVQGTIEEILALEAKLDAGEDHRRVAPPNPTRDCSWRCNFYAVCTMLDDGSRAEDMLAQYFVEVDPLRRYAREVEGMTL